MQLSSAIDQTLGDPSEFLVVHLNLRSFARSNSSARIDGFWFSGPYGARAPTALVVEDDETLRALYVTAFRLRGFAVDEADFAEVAMDRLRERRYDVLVVDVMLPTESGVYVVDKVRSLPDPKPDIIVITGAD